MNPYRSPRCSGPHTHLRMPKHNWKRWFAKAILFAYAEAFIVLMSFAVSDEAHSVLNALIMIKGAIVAILVFVWALATLMRPGD